MLVSIIEVRFPLLIQSKTIDLVVVGIDNCDHLASPLSWSESYLVMSFTVRLNRSIHQRA